MQMMTQEGSVMTHCYWKVNYNFARGRRFIVINGDKGGKNHSGVGYGRLKSAYEGVT